MTEAADAAASPRGSGPRPRKRQPGRGAPGPGSPAPPRCCAGSTPWWSTAPAGILPSPPAPPAAQRRQPDQRLQPAPVVGALVSPRRGESEPAFIEDHLVPNHGQLFPGRPGLLTSPVDAAEQPCPRAGGGQGEPACTTLGGRPRPAGSPEPRRGLLSRRGTSHARSQVPRFRTREHRPNRGASRSKNASRAGHHPASCSKWIGTGPAPFGAGRRSPLDFLFQEKSSYEPVRRKSSTCSAKVSMWPSAQSAFAHHAQSGSSHHVWSII